MDHNQEKRLEGRISRVRGRMKEDGIEAFLVRKNENKYYLSLFRSTSFELIITEDRNYLVTDFRYTESASALEPLYQVVRVDAAYTLHDFLREKGFQVLGLEFKESSVDFYNRLTEAVPDTEVRAFDGVVEEIRVIKDEAEQADLRMAEHIGDQAFSYILTQIRPGISEKEIALKLELKMRELGASGLSFDTICVSGVRSSLPHGGPSDKLIEKGDLVTMDFGCIYNGYCSDMTRTVGVSALDSRQKEIYELVLKAQMAACDFIRAGVSAADADRAARSIIEDAGYGAYFGHGLGHGTGLEIHEAPTANPSSREILRSGMMVTVEPGIYLPGEFGVRIEDLSIVADDGIINITESEKQLIIV